MDQVTLAIISAISTGIHSGTSKVVEQKILDAYAELKDIIEKKYGQNSDLVHAIYNLEERLESDGRKLALQEEVNTVGADKDEDALKLAQNLLGVFEEHNPAIKIVGDGNVVGNNNIVDKITQSAGNNSIQINIGRLAGDETIDAPPPEDDEKKKSKGK
jgi:hypothetical protein